MRVSQAECSVEIKLTKSRIPMGNIFQLPDKRDNNLLEKTIEGHFVY